MDINTLGDFIVQHVSRGSCTCGQCADAQPQGIRPMMKNGELVMADVTTDPRYWDCECETDYIHSKAETTECTVCGFKEDEMPDSHVEELKNYVPNYQPLPL